MAELYASALQLPNVDAEEDAPSIELPKPAWAGAAEHAVYWEVFDPYVDDKPVAGSLDDDVADIYTDLQRGLVLYESQWELAVWEWRFHLRAHWGDHAVDALRALQRVI